MYTEWQPIETAPRNEYGEFLGPTILIFSRADDLPWPAYWGPCHESLSEGAWCLADGEGQFATEDVTHWMFLPEKPNAR